MRLHYSFPFSGEARVLRLRSDVTRLKLPMERSDQHELDARLRGRLVVVSPHLDDAVLSLGATMARAAEAGTQVEVLTVFAYKPNSQEPTDSWDRKSGFATEGEAARNRRNEDHRACSILGVTPRWFDFGAQPYERRASMQDLVSAISAVTTGADTVLIPGYPLAHDDHATLGNALLSVALNCRVVGLYGEQPYLFDRKLTLQGPVATPPPPPPRGDGVISDHDAEGLNPASVASATRQRSTRGFAWQPATAQSSHRRKKLEAVKQYQSQIGGLGLRQRGVGHLRLRMMLWREARQGGEVIAWPKAT